MVWELLIILWSSSKVDVRPLGMSLVILRNKYLFYSYIAVQRSEL